MRRWGWVGLVGGLVLFSALAFLPVFQPGHVLFASDMNLATVQIYKKQLSESWMGHYWGTPLFGNFSQVYFRLGTVLLHVLSTEAYAKWIYGVYLLVGSFFVGMALLRKGLHPVAAMAACIVAYWTGSNFTLLYAGHEGKFGVMCLAGVFVWVAGRFSNEQRLVRWGCLCGCIVGCMLVEQQDLAFFVMLFLGPYFLLQLWLGQGLRFWNWAKAVIPMMLVGVLIALPPAVHVLRSNVTESGTSEKPSAAEDRWDFSTQWSFPPDELIDLLAPGYMGWRSGEPDGPYWGRTGRSSQWITTGQGFQNFRLESVYLGAIPLVLALLSCWFYFRRKWPQPMSIPVQFEEKRVDVIFWSVAGLVALMLSFGKYFPLYAVFYKLPFVGSIRNPNKFIQVFQLAVGILSAYGVDSLLLVAAKGDREERRSWVKCFGFAVLFCAIGLTMFWGYLAGTRSEQEQLFIREGWGSYAAIIVQNMMRGTLHGAFMTSLVGGCVLLVATVRSHRAIRHLGTIVGLVLVTVVASEALLFSRHYVKTVEVDSVAHSDEMIKYLTLNLKGQRVLLLTQEGFYNNLLSVVFPYHNIPAFNIVQMPRMPSDYRQLLDVLSRNPVRLWELAAVGYAMAPVSIWDQVQKDARLARFFTPVMGFRVSPYKGGVFFNPVVDLRQAEHIILKCEGMPRYAWVSTWRIASDIEALNRLPTTTFSPRQEVLVADSTMSELPLWKEEGGGTGRVSLVRSDARNIVVETVSDQPGFVVVSQKYAPDWKVWVDGVRAPLRRCNFIAIGSYVDAGRHEVRFAYSPDIYGLYFQGMGLLISFLAGMSMITSSMRGRG